MQKYRIILFDLDGTLLDFEEAERQALSNAFAEFHLTCSENARYLYHAINNRLWEQLELGLVTREELKIQRFAELFRDLNIPRIDARQMNKVYQEALSHCAFPTQHAHEVCAELAQMCRMYIVTNGTAAVQRSRFAESGMEEYFSGIFISEELGAHKPDPAFFQAVFDRLRCGETEKSGILMVGDTISADMKGALRAGISACWFNPSGKKNYSSFTPHYEIRSLNELPDLICGKMTE